MRVDAFEEIAVPAKRASDPPASAGLDIIDIGSGPGLEPEPFAVEAAGRIIKENAA